MFFKSAVINQVIFLSLFIFQFKLDSLVQKNMLTYYRNQI